jgi:hypothetical protein
MCYIDIQETKDWNTQTPFSGIDLSLPRDNVREMTLIVSREHGQHLPLGG